MSEAELAQKFVNHFIDYDLYFEAPPNHVDIVALAGKKRITIEVKKEFNFKVIEQAYRNTHWFHLSYVATVRPKDYGFREKLCRDYGIGVLYYNPRYMNLFYQVEESVRPVFHKVPHTLLTHVNYSDHMKLSIPGSSGSEGKVVTAFKMTVWELEKYVKRHKGCTLKEALSAIDHHYSSFQSARGSIYQYLANGVIDTICLTDGKLYLTDKFVKESQL